MFSRNLSITLLGILASGLILVAPPAVAQSSSGCSSDIADVDGMISSTMKSFRSNYDGTPFNLDAFPKDGFSIIDETSPLFHANSHEAHLASGGLSSVFVAVWSLLGEGDSGDMSDAYERFSLGGLKDAFGETVDFSNGRSYGKSKTACANGYKITDGEHKGESLIVVTSNGKDGRTKGEVLAVGIAEEGKEEETAYELLKKVEATEAQGNTTSQVMLDENGCGDLRTGGTIFGFPVGC